MAETIAHVIPHLCADVLLVTATNVEGQAVLRLFERELGHPCDRHFIGDKTYFELGVVSGARVFMVQTEMGTSGPGGATLTVHTGIEALSPSAVIMVGIAFGIDPNKQRIGEVLVSRQLLGYELQRVGTGSDGQVVIQLRGDRPSASTRLLDRFRGSLFEWQGLKVDFGLMLSGEKLIDHQDFRDQLHKLEPEAIGGEMEGVGLYAAAQRKKVDWIVVKAICDWADGNKSQRKNSRQKKAAENAAHFTLHVLRLGGFTDNNAGSLNPRGQGNNPQKRSSDDISARPSSAGGVIQAEAITATNVVSGTQIIGAQHIHVSKELDQKQSYPFRPPQRTEHFHASSAALTPQNPPLFITEAVVKLNSASRAERREAIETLSQTNHPAARSSLKDALQHPIKDVRVHAALALVQSLEQLVQAVPSLLEVDSDTDEAVYRQAFAALINADSDAVPGLLAALQSGDTGVRRNAARIFGHIRVNNAPPALLTALQDNDIEVRRYAARALGNIKTIDAVPSLLTALHDSDIQVRRNAAMALIPIAGVDAVPELITALQVEDAEFCRYIAQVLNQIGKDAAPGLLEALKHTNRRVRSQVAEILGRIKPIDAVPELTEALHDEDAEVRSKAAAALGEIGDTSSVVSLFEALRDENPEVRNKAVQALGQIGDSDAVPGLLETLRDENEQVRATSAMVLGKIKSVDAVPRLLKALHDEYVLVRMNAARSLGLMRDESAVSGLRAALHDEVDQVRGLATWALGQIGSTEAVLALSETIDDPDKVVRNTAIDVLRRIGTPEALAILSRPRWQ